MTGGYDPAHFERLFQVEDRHFWFRARNEMIFQLAQKAVSAVPAGYRALEVGCGDGNVLRHLKGACRQGIVTGMDYFAEGLVYARRRGVSALVQGDIARPPFGRVFQLIGVFDVLEHLADDGRALCDLRAMLVPGGTLLLTVAAHPSLWSNFDKASGHCRRYTKEELARKLGESGYHIEFLTEYMAGILPLMWLRRRLVSRGSSAIGAADALKRDLRIVPGVNELLYLLLALEARWVSGFRPLPFGTSLVAVARNV
jgi:SAM-dependent methyltransferase